MQITPVHAPITFYETLCPFSHKDVKTILLTTWPFFSLQAQWIRRGRIIYCSFVVASFVKLFFFPIKQFSRECRKPNGSTLLSSTRLALKNRATFFIQSENRASREPLVLVFPRFATCIDCLIELFLFLVLQHLFFWDFSHVYFEIFCEKWVNMRKRNRLRKVFIMFCHTFGAIGSPRLLEELSWKRSFISAAWPSVSTHNPSRGALSICLEKPVRIFGKNEKRGIPLKVFLFFRKISSGKARSIWFPTGTTGFSTQMESAREWSSSKTLFKTEEFKKKTLA